MFFLKFWLASFTLKVQIIYKNAIIFFVFSKMHILLYYPHLPQVLTILSLPSIPQPPWTNNLKLLMHLKIDLHSFILNFYELKTTSLSLSLHIHQKKTQNFDSKIFMIHRDIEAYDSLVGHFCLRFWVLGEDLCVINKLSHRLKLWNQFFPRFVRPDDLLAVDDLHGSHLAVDNLHGSRLAVDDLHGSILVNAEVSFVIDF